MAMGYATLGQMGFEGRYDYGAIGSVVNLASRLCTEAADGHVLVNQRVYATIEDLVEVETIGDLALKGIARPVAAYNVLRSGEPSRHQWDLAGGSEGRIAYWREAMYSRHPPNSEISRCTPSASSRG